MAKRKRPRQVAAPGTTLESRLFRLAGKLLFCTVVIVLVLTVSQCTIKKPESPTWTTQFTLPLVNRTYPMSELIAKIDQGGIGFDADGNVIYSISREIDTVRLESEVLSTSDITYSVAEVLGEVHIEAPVLAPVTVDIAQIGGLAAFVPGDVPAMAFEMDIALPPAANFTTVTISSGEARITLSNNLGFDLSAVTIDLYDLERSQSLGSQTLASGIPDGGTDSMSFNLAERTISNSLQARLDVSTPGGSVLSTSGKQLTTALRFPTDLSVTSALAEIPALQRDFSKPVALSETDAIYHAVLTGGQLALDVSNQTNLASSVTITFPDIRTGGLPLTVDRSVAPQTSANIAIDLTGCELAPSDSTVPQELPVTVRATTPSTAPQQVEMDQYDFFSVDAALRNLDFGSLTGVFSSVKAVIDPRQETIDVPSGFDSLQLVSAVLMLEIENGVNLAGSLDITIQGDNGKSLNVSGPVAAGTDGAAVVSTIVDSGIAGFLTPVPSVIDIAGSAELGDAVSVATLHLEDYVLGRINIVAPVEVIIPRTPIETDVESESIAQDDIVVVTDHLIESRFIYSVINHLPVGAAVNIYLGGDSATLMSNPQLAFVDDIFVTAAPTTGGIVSDTASTGYQKIIIDSSDAQILRNDPLFIGTELILDDSNGLPVKLTSSDYVTVIGRLEVDYRFDGEF